VYVTYSTWRSPIISLNFVDRIGEDRPTEIYMARRVVVTGLGLLCPLGTSVKQSWTRLIAGDSGIVSLLSHPSTAALRDEYATHPSTVAGVVQENKWLEMLSRDDQRKMSRFAQMAVAASEEALRDSGLNVQKMSVTERERMVSSLN
jgi:3-oxoacyl-[acyl-carrier-protein] synthase II